MRTLDDIPLAADQIARQLGSDKAGTAFVAKWKSEYQKIFQPDRFSKMPLYPKTLIEVQYEPLYAAASDTFLDQIVSLCGGVNIFGKQTGYPRLSREKVFANPPAIILAVDHIQSVKDKNDIIDGWRKFPMTAKAQIIFVNPDIASRPGPRLLEGAKEICAGIKTNSLEHGR
mgnify:CR=1 FL=1